MPEGPSSDGDWGSWEAAHERKITFAADATPAERLAWLEEAIALAHAVGALPRPRELRAVLFEKTER